MAGSETQDGLWFIGETQKGLLKLRSEKYEIFSKKSEIYWRNPSFYQGIGGYSGGVVVNVASVNPQNLVSLNHCLQEIDE